MDAFAARPLRAEFETADPDEARELLDEMYGWRLRVESMRRDRFRTSICQVQVGGVVWADIDLPATVRFHVASRDRFTVSLLRTGTSERFDGGPTFGRGDLFLGTAPDLEEEVRVTEAASRAVQLPAALLDEAASPDPDRPATGWRFRSRRPFEDGAARWNAVAGAFERLIADPQRAGAPLVVGPAVRLLAATALDAFPNDAVTTPAGARDARPRTVQRAISFIEANPGLDIGLEDIARAARVSKRGVQLAFRRQLDTTPTAYLRQVRLSHARRDLQEALPGAGATVTRIALKWGFSSPSRFTAVYRAAYGETPRETLSR